MIHFIRETLARYEEVNHGCDHGAEFELLRLPDAGSLIGSLELYFAAYHTSISPARPARDWQITVSPLADPSIELHKTLSHWLVSMRPLDNDLTLEDLPGIDDLFASLTDTFDRDAICLVTVHTPMFYACEWIDLSLVNADGRYLLHLGYSD